MPPSLTSPMPATQSPSNPLTNTCLNFSHQDSSLELQARKFGKHTHTTLSNPSERARGRPRYVRGGAAAVRGQSGPLLRRPPCPPWHRARCLLPVPLLPGQCWLIGLACQAGGRLAHCGRMFQKRTGLLSHCTYRSKVQHCVGALASPVADLLAQLHSVW